MRPPLVPQPIPIQEQEQKLTKILKQCYNHLVAQREPKTGRIPISLFMCLPSRKDFPKYFEIIEKPISMYEIRKRIENQHYHNEQECIADFKLMFHNCRQFNEDLSQIFQDAVNLEALLLEKYGQLLKEYNVTTKAPAAPPVTAPTITSPAPAIAKPNANASANATAAASTPNGGSNLNHAPPKKRLLTGYIIYAAEVRKEYVDKNPNQDFGFISRLIGNNWKAMSTEDRKAYEQRALIHNKKLREKALASEDKRAHDQRALIHTKKLRDKALAVDDKKTYDQRTPIQHKRLREKAPRDSIPPPAQNPTRGPTTEAATQTARIRFVEPPRKRRLVYSGYIEGLEVPDLSEEAESWLGAGIGRHENTEAALWALWDFMLQDSATMRWSMQPYLSRHKPLE